MADSRLRGRTSPAVMADDIDAVTPPASDLMAWLERQFPVTLPNPVIGIEAMALDCAHQNGNQEVLTVLRSLYSRDRS